MADMNKKQTETTSRGSSSQQTETRTGRETTTRGSSEDIGMQQASMMIRESREEGDPEMQRSEEDLHARQQNLGGREGSYQERGAMGTGRCMGTYEKGLCDRERGMSERERGMSERERGMSDRERAMYDRECAMTDLERSAARGEGKGLASGESRTGGRAGSPQSGMDR